MKNITLVCIDTKNRYESLHTITKMSKLFNFADALYFSNNVKSKDVKIIDIPDIKGKKDGWSYSYFCLMELPKYIETEFCLVVQHDGFIINPEMWTDEFLNYDYIGAPWPDSFVNRVGNGGFSLRSKKFLNACLDIFKNEDILEHEDLLACVYKYYEFTNRGIKFAPVDLALKFSIEHIVPELKEMKSFGFHGTFTEMGRKAIENANNISL
jgi:hypothetical protein